MLSINGIKLKYWQLFWRYQMNSSVEREGTPGRYEPPILSRQTEPQSCSNEHAQYIKMCLCNIGGF